MVRTSVVDRFGCGVGIQIEDRSGRWEAPNPILWYFPDNDFAYSTRNNWTCVRHTLNSTGNAYFSKCEGIIL